MEFVTERNKECG